MSVFPRFSGFIALSGVAQRLEFKYTAISAFAQKIVSKRFYQNNRPKSKIEFCRFCLSRFWAFLGEGSPKNHKQISQKNLTLVLFWPFDPPTHPPRGSPTFFWLPASCT
jgi:hypothetical protein